MSILLQKIKIVFEYILNEKRKKTYCPSYRLIEIIEEDGDYQVLVKLTNKNITFYAKPEEILANNSLVDQFSPRDVRALTYLGYLGINSPKYRILAKKLSENEKISFILKKKGEDDVIIKTADQIISESEIISNMTSEDAKTIGYTVATEHVLTEQEQKKQLLNQLHCQENDIRNKK